VSRCAVLVLLLAMGVHGPVCLPTPHIFAVLCPSNTTACAGPQRVCSSQAPSTA
jgi:hypothetical protein